MGMKIDETIIQATLLKDGVGKDTYKYEILTSLIDIAKKYQKIEEIVNDRYGKPVFKTLDEVIKVVEDGNVDN